MRHVPASRPILFGLTAVLCCGVDLYTKQQVFDTLGYEGISSDWQKEWFDGAVRFKLLTSFNSGALWGIGQGKSWLFAILSIGAALGVMWWLFVAGAARSLWLTLALALVTGGALGNLYDRLGLHGCTGPDGEVLLAVRDFLLFEFGGWGWPVFNFADVFLVTGAMMLALQSLAPPREAEDPALQESNADGASAQPADAPAGG
ncbi:signal peptidase II [Alienimonas chondri]|nr:signal peptidase II [Alienimonas chondri]